MLVFQMRYQMRYVDKTSTVLKQTKKVITQINKYVRLILPVTNLMTFKQITKITNKSFNFCICL